MKGWQPGPVQSLLGSAGKGNATGTAKAGGSEEYGPTFDRIIPRPVEGRVDSNHLSIVQPPVTDMWRVTAGSCASIRNRWHPSQKLWVSGVMKPSLIPSTST